MKHLWTAAVLIGLSLDGRSADAQTVGTFQWQQQPHCNVFTLLVTQVGGTYRLEGSDDQCGAARRASVMGLAFPNPNGTIGMGLTVVTNNGGAIGGAPLHLDVTLTLATVSGTWRDNSGQSGTWTFVPAGGSGGSPRPAPVLAPGIVTSTSVASGAVSTEKIADGAVTASKLAAGAVSTGTLADGAVTASKLAAGSVSTEALAAGAVTAAKLAATAFDGRLFASIVGMGVVNSAGAMEHPATGSTATSSRSSEGNYSLTVPGLDPGCTNSRFVFAVLIPTTTGRSATASSFATISCGSGNSSTAVSTRDGAGALADSGFTFILFRMGT